MCECMNENEYLHNTRDVFDRFRICNRQKYMYIIYDEDITETGKIHLLYCEDIRSHSYLFYICQHEYGSRYSTFKVQCTTGQ